MSLLLCNAAPASSDWRAPNSIQGDTDLYADLDGDGHIERVVLVPSTSSADDPSYSDYVHKHHEAPTGRSLVHNLRKVNGQVWGDIIVFAGTDDDYLSKGKTDSETWLYMLSDSYWYEYKTARLETCPGGMRIAEYLEPQKL
ncbi:hypothetical protein IJT17_10560 [bacterium]|nr:hypothetical protein [bacterium]